MEYFILIVGILLIAYACYLIGKSKSGAEAKPKETVRDKSLVSPQPKRTSSVFLTGANKYGRLENAVGLYGYSVSNPICINTIGDKEFFSYMDNMTDGKGVISGYAVVSVCLCALFPDKVMNKIAVRLSDEKTFVTLFVYETNKFTSKYYPKGLMSKEQLSEIEYIKSSNSRISLKIDKELNAILDREANGRGMLPSREKMIEYNMPVRRVGESDHYFSLRMEAYKLNKGIRTEYQKFKETKDKDAVFQAALKLHRSLVKPKEIKKEEYEGNKILDEYLHGTGCL